jgi:hypothetical protein
MQHDHGTSRDQVTFPTSAAYDKYNIALAERIERDA